MIFIYRYFGEASKFRDRINLKSEYNTGNQMLCSKQPKGLYIVVKKALGQLSIDKNPNVSNMKDEELQFHSFERCKGKAKNRKKEFLYPRNFQKN